MNELDAAVAELRSGRLVVVPTDTVYGLAALPGVPGAVDALFSAKGRSPDKPIPILGSSLHQLTAVARFDGRAARAAEGFWPGGLTLVLPRADGFEVDLGGSRRATVGVRVPANGAVRRLLELTGPLAVTSANRSGGPAAKTVEEAQSIFGSDVAVYLDDGPATGEPSTVLYLVGEAQVLRPGVVASEDVLAVLRPDR